MKINREIELTEYRCPKCGRWWALESSRTGSCPRCAYVRSDERFRELDAANRTIAALRGALTKAKKGRT
jgi:ssDNA-binding Zn-finger/Zn-ribbon topoisomerase 1